MLIFLLKGLISCIISILIEQNTYDWSQMKEIWLKIPKMRDVGSLKGHLGPSNSQILSKLKKKLCFFLFCFKTHYFEMKFPILQY